MKKIIMIGLILSWSVFSYAGTKYISDCEFPYAFPGKPKIATSYVGSVAVTQRYYYPSDNTMLRAECIPVGTITDTELVNILRIQANATGIESPTISIESTSYPRVGIYSGERYVAGHKIRVHGEVLVGIESTLHLSVFENANIFPSKSVVNFLDSYK